MWEELKEWAHAPTTPHLVELQIMTRLAQCTPRTRTKG
jgi:hypothetical protein